MKVAQRVRTLKLRSGSHLKVLVLCTFFALGVLLGGMAHSAVSAEDNSQLREYLLTCTALTAQPEDITGAVIAVLIMYFRYPLIVFLCGFTTAGIVLIPSICAVQGFFLSFAINSFGNVLGQDGVMLAAAAFGVRCLFTLPCTLFLALYAVSSSVHLVQQRAGGSKPVMTGQLSAGMIRLAVCAFAMLIGVVVELSLVPKLLQLALTNIT